MHQSLDVITKIYFSYNKEVSHMTKRNYTTQFIQKPRKAKLIQMTFPYELHFGEKLQVILSLEKTSKPVHDKVLRSRTFLLVRQVMNYKM